MKIRRVVRGVFVGLALGLVASAWAETITLTNGRREDVSVLAIRDGQVHFLHQGELRNVSLSQVSSIEGFKAGGSGGSKPAAPPARPAPPQAFVAPTPQAVGAPSSQAQAQAAVAGQPPPTLYKASDVNLKADELAGKTIWITGRISQAVKAELRSKEDFVILDDVLRCHFAPQSDCLGKTSYAVGIPVFFQGTVTGRGLASPSRLSGGRSGSSGKAEVKNCTCPLLWWPFGPIP